MLEGTHRRAFVKLFEGASRGRYTDWNIWEDLMFFGATALAQPMDYQKYREDEYLRRQEKYDKDTQQLLVNMFGEIVLAFEEEGFGDILGELYQEFGLSSKWKGQFFTPFSVCRAMSKASGDPSEAIKENGYISVNDPSCGGGATLIAFAEHCADRKVNYQQDVLFVGQDLDPVVARMCYIQLSLLGCPGYVQIGNTLTLKYNETLYTPMYWLYGVGMAMGWRSRYAKEICN
jgi:type I restriction-modification system DNA methylase subunit